MVAVQYTVDLATPAFATKTLCVGSFPNVPNLRTSVRALKLIRENPPRTHPSRWHERMDQQEYAPRGTDVGFEIRCELTSQPLRQAWHELWWRNFARMM